MKLDGKYYISDIESGVYTKVTKEQYEAYINMIESFKPKLSNIKGKIIIYGTSGDLNNNEDLKDIFYNSINYKRL